MALPRDLRGLPIAAHLGLLVALAFASAFVVMLAVVIWLPPRPPDVARGDILMDQFAAGYGEVTTEGDLPSGDEMSWRLRREPPEVESDGPLLDMRAQLAERLRIPAENVRIAAETARGDVFVFRVRDMKRRVRAFERHVEGEAETIDRRNGAIISGSTVILAPEGGDVVRNVQVVREPEGQVSVEVGVSTWQSQAPPPTPRTARVAPVSPVAPVPPTPPLFAPAPAGVLLLTGYDFAARLPDGRWLTMRQGRDWEELGWIGRAALVIGGTLTALSLLALLFARRLTRPIRNFSDAVQAVGVDPQSEPVREEGPNELRGAARAVNTMQARLRALIADRTKMLAAVAHDMRTPLMRLRLVAENVAPEQRERMAKEIGEVEALVASFIAFARDDPAEEARVRIDLAALLQSLADDNTEAGRDVTYAGDERLVITGQSLGLKRLFANLIGNAVKYGGVARVSLTRGEGVVIIDVADEGPGIPPAQRETVFEPFVRLNDAQHGAGLGLPAARSIARAHGGDIAFVDAERGALARVTLPG